MAHALAASPPPQVTPAAHVVHGVGLLDAGQTNPMGHAAVQAEAAAASAGHVTPPAHAPHAVLHAVVLPSAQ